MSEYKFCCSHCGQHLAGTEEWAGRMLQCPSCQREFQAPQLAAPPPSLRIAGATPSEVPPVLPAQSELERQVLAGGRFVIFQYCISVLVMTFKRSSAITFIQPGGDGAGPAITHSLISLLVGWWGIPWGPIWTISSVIKNARGGTDVTQAVLTEQLGPGRAAQIMAQRRVVPPNGWGLKAFRWGLAGFSLLLLLFVALPFVMAFSSASSRYSNRTFAPGEAEFRAANNQIGVNRGGVAFGNSPKAIAVANQFSTSMKALQKTQFEGGKPGGASLSGHEFITYCELRDAECAIIVHVPELRRYKLGAKEALGELAWETAQKTLRSQGVVRPGMKLAVGLRGIALYDRVLLGRVTMPSNLNGNGLSATITTSRPEQELFGYFQSPQPALPAPAN